jgi:hypothetical protein
MLTIESLHDPAGDLQECQMFCLIADKIDADPSLLHIPLANVDRWLAKGHRAVEKLNEWRALVVRGQGSQAGMKELLAVLRDDSEKTRWFKGWTPVWSIMTDEDKMQFPWISRH